MVRAGKEAAFCRHSVPKPVLDFIAWEDDKGSRHLRVGTSAPRGGGGLWLREVEQRAGMVRQFAACFGDHRAEQRIEHTVEELVSQRVLG